MWDDTLQSPLVFRHIKTTIPGLLQKSLVKTYTWSIKSRYIYRESMSVSAFIHLTDQQSKWRNSMIIYHPGRSSLNECRGFGPTTVGLSVFLLTQILKEDGCFSVPPTISRIPIILRSLHIDIAGTFKCWMM